MTAPPVQETRIQSLNDLPVRSGDYVLYWMQQSQRAEWNHALSHAIQEANRLKKPVIVVFGLTDRYPDANLRHYTFMLQGLRSVAAELADRGIRFVMQIGDPPEVALKNAAPAAMIVCDRGYLRHQRQWRRTVAEQADCRVVQVESDVVVPTESVFQKAEYAARTIRPKIHGHLDEYLVACPDPRPQIPASDIHIHGLDLSAAGPVLAALTIDRKVPAVDRFFTGGTREAKRRFGEFCRTGLAGYKKNRNQPQTDDVSHMGMYLHFGQISPVWLALEIKKADTALAEQRDAFLEELVVRRELAVNFVEQTSDYDRFSCIPDWARKTLDVHRKDPRPHTYTLAQLDSAATQDDYWNAAMTEMKVTGYMHNYMRMYWGKKILEWSADPEDGFENTLRLNNRYFLDGRDPNSYAGVAWVYGIHDRGWPERPVFGKVRSMTAAGLERKCDIRAYVEKVGGLSEQQGE